MRAKLFCRTGSLAGSDFELGKEATIGSHPANSIVLSAETISKKHARIYYDQAAESYFLEDLGSSNGTRLDGVRFQRPERLEDLHVITFAEKHDFFFKDLSEQPVPTESHTLFSAGEGLAVPQFADADPEALEKAPRDKTVFMSVEGLQVPSFSRSEQEAAAKDENEDKKERRDSQSD